MKDKLYLYQIQLMLSYYQRAPVIVWFYTGTHWLLYAHKTKTFLGCRDRRSEMPNIGTSGIRNAETGTSALR